MRYALGLSMVGAGALLVYSGFKNRSAWDIVRQAISPGAPTRTTTAVTPTAAELAAVQGGPGGSGGLSGSW